MRAGFIRPNPYNNKMLHHPDYEPFWNAAEELDMAIGIHEGSSLNMPPQICSVRTRIRLVVPSPASGSAVHALLTLVYRPWINTTQRKRVFGATHATAHIGLGSAPGAISYSVKSVISA